MSPFLASGILADERGDDEAERLQAIERALEAERSRVEALGQQTDSLEAEVGELQKILVQKARTAQSMEDQLSAVEVTLAKLEAEESGKRRALANQRRQLVRTLGALERIAVQPPELALVAPGAPLDAVRSAILLDVAVGTLDQRAKILRGQLDELLDLRGQIAARRSELRNLGSTLDSELGSLEMLTARKQQLYDKASRELDATLKRAAERAAEAKSLRGLVERLEREAKARERASREEQRTAPGSAAAATLLTKPSEIRPFPASKASLVMPARGPVVVNFGDRDRANPGATAKGITLATRPNAQVVAPFDGQVVYAGNFRGYGQILIIEHGGRYHSLLAGVERLNATVGQWVLAGEPVGAMGRPSLGDPRLYIELRRTGQPINPLPWLARINDKVQG